jgi:murein DD-endopeptidase MepM/ murein hydrolase activator NlpD
MIRARGRRALLLLALSASFGAGVLVDGWLRTHGPPTPAQAAAQPLQAPAPRLQTPTQPSQTPAQPTVIAPPPPVNSPADATDQPTVEAAPVVTTGDPAATTLRLPIDGISIESFKGGFAQMRGALPHEGVDIMAPRGTPIHAVQDGTIAKLFFSRFGGVTIYEFNDGWLCFYYAHLERYADGLHDGQRVSQGEVIGYVGTSGNAPPETPHLHFSIFELNADRKWWQGRALDPYLVYKETR